MCTELKIKLKSLAAEARIIKHEEQKRRGPNWGWSAQKFYLHRIKKVRPEIRATHIAYGYLRGKPFNKIESGGHVSGPKNKNMDFDRVDAMVKKYGTKSQRDGLETWFRDGGVWTPAIRKELETDGVLTLTPAHVSAA